MPLHALQHACALQRFSPHGLSDSEPCGDDNSDSLGKNLLVIFPSSRCILRISTNSRGEAISWLHHDQN